MPYLYDIKSHVTTTEMHDHIKNEETFKDADISVAENQNKCLFGIDYKYIL